MTDTSNPYKILFVRLAPGAKDHPINQADEFIKIQEAVSESKNFELLKDTKGYSLQNIVKAINDHNPNCIHLSGHGSKSKLEIPDYSLLVDGEPLNSIKLSQENIKIIFGDTQKDTKPRILFFNVCLASGIVDDNDEGKALLSHFDCVIAMHDFLDQTLALNIAESFYTSIAQGVTVEKAIESLKATIISAKLERNQDSPSGFDPQPTAFGNDKIKFDLNIGSPRSTPSNIPWSTVVKFVGREQDIEKLHQQVQQENQIAITGVDGIGKTELAIQYAAKYRQVYSGGLYYFLARDTSSLADQMLDFAQGYLKLGDKEKGAEVFREKLKSASPNIRSEIANWFWQLEQEQTVLVLFDDVIEYEQLRLYLPPRGKNFKILVTTQRSPEDIFKEFQLLPLGKSAALDLLRQPLADKIDRELSDAQVICKDLGYLPLALNLVGFYVKKRDISLAEMKNRLEQEGTDQQALKENRQPIFELSWSELSPKAKDLAFLLSLLPSTSNLLEFQGYLDFLKKRLDFLRSSLGENGFSVLSSIKNARDIEDARVNLEEWNFAVKNQSSYSLNPLVRQFFLDKMMGSANDNKIVQVLGLSHSDPNRAVLPADFPRLHTVNEFVGYPGCYIAAYSHQQQGSAYSVKDPEGKDIYVMGQVRVSGRYQPARDGINMCVPDSYTVDSVISADKHLNQKFSETLSETCKNDSCWAGGDTAGFLERRTGRLDELTT